MPEPTRKQQEGDTPWLHYIGHHGQLGPCPDPSENINLSRYNGGSAHAMKAKIVRETKGSSQGSLKSWKLEPEAQTSDRTADAVRLKILRNPSVAIPDDTSDIGRDLGEDDMVSLPEANAPGLAQQPTFETTRDIKSGDRTSQSISRCPIELYFASSPLGVGTCVGSLGKAET
ncbi:hypothetical protein HOY80DRAFT_1000307 [Tuber brumale]|nr:hypothetical protein HOY80DRAFT_1000307 [Tuber brumale]